MTLRQAAIFELLALEDEPGMEPRVHVLTQEGDPDRFEKIPTYVMVATVHQLEAGRTIARVRP